MDHQSGDGIWKLTLFRNVFQVLKEFAHGKQQKVSKTGLLGMATGLKRDPIVILRMDGEDLLEFINGPSYEAEMVSIFSQIGCEDASLRDCITKALEKLTVDQGMPPFSDSWVFGFLHLSFRSVILGECEFGLSSACLGYVEHSGTSFGING